MNEITIGDKIYISAKRAAEITGYARDYVGQLCREGHIDAKMVGRSWYVYEPSIRAHRFGDSAVVANTPAETTESVAPESQPETPQQESVGSEEPAVAAPTTGWESAKYTSETPLELPELPKPTYEELLPPTEETLTDMQAAWREWFERKQQDLETPEIEAPGVMEARAEAATEPIESPEEELEQKQEANEEEVTAVEQEEEEEIAVPLHRIQDERVYFEPVREQEPAVLRSSAPHIEEDAEPIAIRAIYTAPSAPRRAVEPAYTPVSTYPTTHTSAPVAAPIPAARIISERVITKRPSAKPARRSNAPIIAALISVSVISIVIAFIGSGKADRYVKTFSTENPVINFLVGTREYKR